MNRRSLRTLYIDADEDHVSLQYLEHKGDIKRPRINTVMPRIIYVYEGVDTDEEGRPKLINTKYFGGIYDGQESIGKLWTEVLDYLNKAYDMEAVDKIYINGDGASWIRTGEKIIPKSKFALDKYHMHKYIIAATSHLEDSTEDTREKYIGQFIKEKNGWLRAYLIRLSPLQIKRQSAERLNMQRHIYLGIGQGLCCQ